MANHAPKQHNIKPDRQASQAKNDPIQNDSADILNLQYLLGNSTLRGLLNPQQNSVEVTYLWHKPEATEQQAEKPTIRPEILEGMDADVAWIIEKLNETFFSSSEQAQAIAMIKKYAAMDHDYAQTSGYTGTDHLDKFLLKLKGRTITRSGITSVWQDQTMLVYDSLWHELDKNYQSQFSELVSQSHKKSIVAEVDKGPENFLKTLGKQELIGLGGMIKGLGLGAAGVVDAASGGVVKGLKKLGMDIADPIQYTKLLEEQYKETGTILSDMLFDADPKQDEALLLGMNASEIGTKGGGLIWNLVMAGAAPGAGWAKGAKAGMDVATSLGGIVDAADRIVAVVSQLQASDKLSVEALLTNAEFLQATAALAMNIGGAMGTGKKLDPNIAPALKTSLERLGILLTASQMTATLTRLSEILISDNMEEKAKEKATAEAVVELLGHGFSIAADLAGDKELGKSEPDVEAFDPNLRTLDPGDPHAPPLELDYSNNPNRTSAEAMDPNLRTLDPGDPYAPPLELDYGSKPNPASSGDPELGAEIDAAFEQASTPKVTGGKRSRIDGRAIPPKPGRRLDMEDIPRLDGESMPAALDRVRQVNGKLISDIPELNAAWVRAKTAVLSNEALTKNNYVDLYDRTRNRFWQEVRKDSAASRYFTDNGFEFPESSSRAAQLRVNDLSIPDREKTVSLDHVKAKAKDQNWQFSLDANNLELTFSMPNTDRQNITARHKIEE